MNRTQGWTQRWIGHLVLGALLAMGMGAAQASRPVPQVTGSVSAVSSSSITINGMTYQVLANTKAVEQLRQVQPGQSVTVLLNGPPTSATSQVIGMIPSATAP